MNRSDQARRPPFYALANCILSFLLLSVGVVCLSPVALTADLTKIAPYRYGASDSCGVSLMFNVYEGTKETESILSVLERYGAKATFFVGGSWADDNDECLKKILSGGHELGNHGYFHKDHAALDEKGNREEIASCNEYVRLVTGVSLTLFAPPSGSYSETTLKIAESLGMKTILWSRDTIDWRDRNSASIYTRATKNIQKGEFVLMHPFKETAEALPDILSYYRKEGIEAITVSDNLRLGG